MTKDTGTKPRQRARLHSSDVKQDNTVQFKVFVLVLSLSAILVGVYIQVTRNISESLNKSSKIANSLYDDTLIAAEHLDAGYLDHVIAALLDNGHKLTFRGTLTPAQTQDLDRFKLIWTHDYPFTEIKKLHPRQRINHFPGTGFITNKVTLSTTPNVPNVLRAFRLPAQKEKFHAQIKNDPANKPWIQKSSSHRGISIETAETVNLDLEDTLVQEYMSNPLLIDGKKFDIGIYAVLTSVEPLRVYIYESESLLRFCEDTYLDKSTGRFNSSNMNSYVVGDDYTPIWLMPSLLRYYIGANLSMKQTLNSYLKRLGKDGNVIWRQIETTIKRVYELKEPHLARMSKMYQEANNYNSTSVEGSLNQFFEMVRFDFIIDEDLKVYLMEANMSPNLSSRHFPPNRLLYEQVLHSFFSLVGLTHYARQNLYDLPVHHLDGKMSPTMENIKTSASEHYGLDQIINEKELAVDEELCVSNECHMNCVPSRCRSCYFCLNYATKLHLRRAIFEHQSRWNFKRLLPTTLDDERQYAPEANEQMSEANSLHEQWFRAKCRTDQRFCSY